MSVERYEQKGEARSGGFGDVYQAWDTALHRDVAFKRIVYGTDSQRNAILQEARLLAQLDSHPNVVRVHDVIPGNSFVGIVMEWVEGQTLADVIRQRGPLPLEEAFGIAENILSALAFVHGKDIVHSDLKPGNVMVRNDGAIKLVDFGIARIVGAAGVRSVQFLTLPYAAPEYFQPPYKTGAPADLWAVGVMLYEMITGKHPFEIEAGVTGYAEVKAWEEAIVSCQYKPLIEPPVQAILDNVLVPTDHRLQTATAFLQFVSESRPLVKSYIAKRRMIDLLLQKALQTAKSIEDLYWRSSAYKKIAEVQAASGDLAIALQTVKDIEDVSWQSEALRGIAETQVLIGDLPNANVILKQAFQVAKSMEDVSRQSEALRGIAEAQAASGDLAGALQTVKSIEDQYHRSKVLTEIAKTQVATGDLAGALQTAENIGFVFDRSWAFIEIAKAQMAGGDLTSVSVILQQALQIAKSFEGCGDPDLHSSVFAEIAEVQAASGDLAGAFQIAKSIEDVSWQSQALGGIAEAQAASGDLAGALQTVESIEDECPRSSWVFIEIAKAQMAGGDLTRVSAILQQALQTERSYGYRIRQSSAFPKIAEVQAASGDLVGALKTAENIEDVFDRSCAFTKIAKVQAVSGDFTSVSTILQQAFQTAKSIGSPNWRSLAFEEIVEVQATIGNLEDALETVKSIDDVFRQSEILSKIVDIQISGSNLINKTVKQAFKTAINIVDMYWRSSALSDIAMSVLKMPLL